MKKYRLMTETAQYAKGTIFSFEDKHKFMASLPWQATRDIIWEEVADGNYWH